MKYKILITKDDEYIFSKEIPADEVVGILTNAIWIEEGTGEKVEKPEKKSYTKKLKEVRGGGKVKGKRRTILCKNCGEHGHQARTCPNERKIVEQDDGKEQSFGEPMSELQYKDVETAHDHGLKASQIAVEMSLGMRDVNLVLQTSNYQVYLKRRK